MAERKTGKEGEIWMTKKETPEGYLPDWKTIEEEHEALYEDWKYKCEVIATQMAKIEEARKIVEHATYVLHSIFIDEDRGLLGPEAEILQKINDWLRTGKNKL